jgi:anti-anti-sigma regulatory factor
MPRAKKSTAAQSGRRKPAAAKPAKAKAKTRKSAAKSIGAVKVSETLDASSEPFSGALLLPDCLDSAAAQALKGEMLGRRGTPLEVDASQVRRVGAQSLQVLIAAARTWQADGLAYHVTNSSSELLDTIALIGLSREDLMLEGSNA